ncbi:hypothetical protein BDE02_14G002300 [Populus trichocarpa]|nr:hypothetical protein BDE02_14G002300 [Populus trichocarpa]
MLCIKFTYPPDSKRFPVHRGLTLHHTVLHLLGVEQTSPWHQHLIFCGPHASAFASPATPLLLLVYVPYDLSDVDALPL